MSEEKVRKLNGIADRASIVGWVIALIPGRAVVGRPLDSLPGPSGECRHLSPVFDFTGALVPQQDQRTGQIVGLAQQIGVQPMFGLTGISGLDLPPGTPCIAIDLLHDRERSVIGAQVAKAQAVVEQLRAAQSGITLAPAGMKLPPMPGVSR
jgi:hypothetical protein